MFRKSKTEMTLDLLRKQILMYRKRHWVIYTNDESMKRLIERICPSLEVEVLKLCDWECGVIGCPDDTICRFPVFNTPVIRTDEIDEIGWYPL